MTPDQDLDDAAEDAAVDSGPLDRKALAESALLLLQGDPSKYRTFGPYWPIIKALLLRYYTRDNLFLLGPHVDREAAEHMPPHASLDDALRAAVEFHRNCSAYGLGTNEFTDEATGDVWRLVDPDAGGL